MTAASAVFAIILLGCVFGMLYYSFQNQKQKDKTIPNMYNVRFDADFTDSVTVAVNDSVVYEGTANDTIFVGADGNNIQNMISVDDHSIGKSLNQDLPVEPSAIIISGKENIKIETQRIMAPGN